MRLKFGVSSSGALVNVYEAAGRSKFSCPYCGGALTALKGRGKAHYFAHTEKTCVPVIRRIQTLAFPSLPLYDNFNLQLSDRELKRLKELWCEYGENELPISKNLIEFSWIFKGLMQIDNSSYSFTPQGKIPVGGLPLALFNEVLEPLLLEELAKLEYSASVAHQVGLPIAGERQADKEIYRAQLRRILLNSLYFLEVRADGKTFHKIGTTTKPIEQRIDKVQQDTQMHAKDVAVNLLGLWNHRGNVELYFKHRYSPFHFRIGRLGGYFHFPNAQVVLDDLHSMPPKVLSDAERAVL